MPGGIRKNRKVADLPSPFPKATKQGRFFRASLQGQVDKAARKQAQKSIKRGV